MLIVITLVLVCSAIGVLVAWLAFGRQPVPVERPPAVSSAGHRAARRNLYADAFNEAADRAPGQWLTRALVYVDNRGVDGAVNGLGRAPGRRLGPIAQAADRLRPLATRCRCWAARSLVVAALLAVRFA